MDLDIQFGELEEAQPEAQRRPDRNKQFAVAAYETPEEGDLPIFVDLDVMRDIELHAVSDTSVELGGVLLGGQYQDEDGRPFVVVTDSLRAQHFEATKGSFKFTHETWEKISRERDEFPENLQMVGWYHTHPDWGVFLSSMDMFICDNFFNRPLDLALVVDPCRGDRGMFMWTGRTNERIRRCGGFYLIASRFRREELEFFAASLEGKQTMPATDPRFGFPIHMSTPAPVVNISESRNSWHGPLIAGMLTVQLLVLVLLAWKLLDPLSGVAAAEQPADDKPKEKTVAEQIQELRQEVARHYDDEQRSQAQNDAQQQMLRTIVAGMQGGSPMLVDQLEQRQIEVAQLQSDLRGQKALVVTLDDQRKHLHGERDEANKAVAALTRTKKNAEEKIEDLNKKSKDDKAQIDDLTEAVKQRDAQLQGEAFNPAMVMFWVYLAAAAVTGGVVGAGIMYAARRHQDAQFDEDQYESDDSRRPLAAEVQSDGASESQPAGDDGRPDAPHPQGSASDDHVIGDDDPPRNQA
jgi:proteasome lid subunit RPN8/RPN11